MIFDEQHAKFLKDCQERNIPKERAILCVALSDLSDGQVSATQLLESFVHAEEMYQLVFRGEK